MEIIVDSMPTATVATQFAPAERAAPDVLRRQYGTVKLNHLLTSLLRAMPGYVMLLNPQRQIVAVNNNVLCAAGCGDETLLLGKRPGEALNCLHAYDGPAGCGTGTYCSVCGAVKAILESQERMEQVSHECCVVLNMDEQVVLDMQAEVTPIEINNEIFTVLVLRDISSEKRREVLEKVFFHDVINTAGGIHGLASILAEQSTLPEHVEREYKNWLVTMSGNLVEEIRAQRRLLMAEQGEYVPNMEMVELRELLLDVSQLYSNHERTPGRILILDDVPACSVMTDSAVLRRIVGNMVLNALEATPMGGTVRLGAYQDGPDVVIHVHNPGEIPKDVQLQLFQRSFSTKSTSGRGVGTYSMKLFGERYLKGQVSFTSSAESGTQFSFRFPYQA